jgi:hypothetical protein
MVVSSWQRSLPLALVAWAALAGCARHLPPAERVEVSNVVALRTALGGGAAESSSAGPAAAAAEPTGWATLKGSFKLNGTPPQRVALDVNKDQAVCAPGGKPVLSESLVVDSASGGIKDVVIYLVTKYPAQDARWEHPDLAANRETTLTYDQKNCVFLSHMFAMRSTQKLKILNSDSVGHNTKIDASGKAASINATIPVASYTLYEPGGESAEPFNVSCSIHNWMSARMLVRDTPYFAVTKPDGSFEIQNVPAGVPLEFRAWQEQANFLQKVAVNGKAETWPKGRFKVALQPDEQKTLDVVVDAAVFGK